jgi:hypothetical protein
MGKYDGANRWSRPLRRETTAAEQCAHAGYTKSALRRVAIPDCWGRNIRHAHAASGNSIRNVVPRPTSDVKSIEPL